MGIFSRIVNKVRQTVSNLRRRSRSAPPPPTSNTFSASSNVDNAASKLEAIARAAEPDKAPREISRELAHEARREIQDLLDPISRSGNARRSIQVKENPDDSYSVITDGTAPYLEAIEEGDVDSGVPPVQNLLEWMKYKNEFSGLPYNRRKKIAYAIQRSMRDNRTPNKTGRSDLVDLPPRGERRYEFTKESLRRMEADITGVGSAFGQGIQ